MIGRTFDDKDVQKDLKHFPFKIVNKGGKPMISVNNRGDLKDFVSGTTESIRAVLTTRPRSRSRLWFLPR